MLKEELSFIVLFSQTWKTLKSSGKGVDTDVLHEIFPQWMEESLESFGMEFPDTTLSEEDVKTTLSSLSILEQASRERTDQKAIYFRETLLEIRNAIQEDDSKKKSHSLFHTLQNFFLRKRTRIPLLCSRRRKRTFVLTIGSAHFPGFSENPSASIFEITPREEAEERKMNIQRDYNDSSQKLFPIPQKEYQCFPKKNAEAVQNAIHTVQNGNGKTELTYELYENQYQSLVSSSLSLEHLFKKIMNCDYHTSRRR